MRALRFAAAVVAALLAHLLLVALVPPAARVVDPFLLAIVYTAMTMRPGAAAAGGATLGLVHDALSGGLYGMNGFTGTLVAFVMARMARLVDLQKSYYVALYFACAVLLQQLVLQGLLVLLLQRPEMMSIPDLALRVALGGPAGALLVASIERLGESLGSWKRRRAEIFLGAMVALDSQERLRLLVQRTWQLTALLGAAFTVVAVGYWYTQIVRGGYYRELAENNRLRELKVEAPRGVILDRESRPLVENVPSYFLLFDRGRSESQAGSVAFLARTLERPEEELERVLASSAGQASYMPVVMAEDLTLDQVARLEAAALEHPEFEIEVRQRRFYRHATQTAHVVGYLGEAGKRALDRRPDLHAGDLVGVKGVEQTYDSILRGTDGRRVVVVDSRGKFVHEELREASLPGGNLQLTLDLELQQEAERLFVDRVGSAVALDPRNGEILAMVSAPSFNPNAFARRIDSSEWRPIVGAPHQPLQNRAMQNTYPPGSVFKIDHRASPASRRARLDPATPSSAPERREVFNHRFRCWKKAATAASTSSARSESCNVFFYHLGARLGDRSHRGMVAPPRAGRPDRHRPPGREVGLLPDGSGACASAAPCGSPARPLGVDRPGAAPGDAAPDGGDDGGRCQRRPVVSRIWRAA